LNTPPPVDAVHVWIGSETAADETRLRQYRSSLLTAEECARADRFYRHADRARFLMARAMVRTMLSRYVPIDPADWRFRIAAHGRPEVAELPAGAPDLRFNLSHTAGLVGCAMTVGRDVGLDVECINRELTHDVAERFFSEQEVADLRAVPLDEQATVFFDYWTLKEAYIKARGLGLSLPLAQFSFTIEPEAVRIAFDPRLEDDPASWQFMQQSPTRRHRLAAAVRRGPGPDLRFVVQKVVPLAP
jgi:4'-phosphopantetheinyl transferase